MENKKSDNSKKDAHKSLHKSFKAFFVKNYINAIRKKEQHQKEEQKSSKIEERNTKVKLTENVNVIFTIILAISTAYLTYYTRQLFGESINQRTQAERQFEIEWQPVWQQSDDIGISNWNYLPVNKRDSFSIIRYTFTNFSRGPVKVNWSVFGIRYSNVDPSQFFKSGDNILVNTHQQWFPVNAAYTPSFDRKIINTKASIDSLEKGKNTFYGIVCFENYITTRDNYFVFSVNIRPLDTIHRNGPKYFKEIFRQNIDCRIRSMLTHHSDLC
jgi:hypothetical protein